MRWLASNLWLLSILAAICVVGVLASFVRIRVVKPKASVLWTGALCLGLVLVALGVGIFQVVSNPPGPSEVVDEEEFIPLPPDAPKAALARLRIDWNSQAVADWPASEVLADLSEIAYLPPHEAEKSFHSLGFTKVMPVVQSSMIGYVITGEDVTVVVFRGTDFNEVSDWLANLGRSAIQTPNGPVHRGFYAAYQSMKAQVDAILDERDTTHLWVAGHSLGGALALVCAYDLEGIEKRNLNGLMTFGQPMVARQQFADYIDELFLGRYARFVNRDDIVPKVPPSHVACGSLVWFTDEGVKRSKVKEVLYGTGDPVEVPMPVEEGAEIEPLSESEFRLLQARLKSGRAVDEAHQNLPRTMEYREEEETEPFRHGNTAAQQMAASSLIDDHSMWLYLEKIRTLLGIDQTEAP